jgi:DNA-binding CsgD family transcriptional regulator
MTHRRTWWIAAIVCLQAIAAVFFAVDEVADIAADAASPSHLLVEGVIAAALMLGVVLNAWQLREMMAEARRARSTIQAASGAMAELMALRFAEWRLTDAEADVAMLALKGFDTDEIARFRGAAPGTVRAQLARIYAKAEVRSRAGLAGLFIEDLMTGPLPPLATSPLPAAS